MDPVIMEIYRTYFDREYWRTVGTPDRVSLLSAIQMKYWHTPEPAYQVALNGRVINSPSEPYEKDVAKAAFDLVSKYSTYIP